MKSYVKPIVLENEELTEGIYAASGDEIDNNEPSVPGENPPEGGSSEPEGGNPPTDEVVGEVDGECWTVKVEPEQRDGLDGDNGNGHKNFRVIAEHPSVAHISTSSTVTIVFNSVITDVYWEHGDSVCEFSGSTVTIVRPGHANGYYSPDNYNSVLKVRAGDDITTLNLEVLSAGITCAKAVNVQGGF